MMYFRKPWRAFIGVVILVTIVSFLSYSIYCGHSNCVLTKVDSDRVEDWQFDPRVIHKEYELDLENEDVLVFLHIQKTGGTTFGRHLVKNLDLDKPCLCKKKVKRCKCLTRNKTLWLFSRYSTGWACGLHADWTELQNCVEKAMDKQEHMHRTRRYHYISILREPVSRYLSEWRHVQRGATWKTAEMKCNGRQATLEEVPFCYEGENWEGVDLESFLECKYNLANNRQTRMLSNLSKVNCYNSSGMTEEERNEVMLQSAKENLLNLDFFGLTEFQRDTQLLFEHTFHIEFIKDFTQNNHTHSHRTPINDDEKQQILEKNQLDAQLYEYAKKLFIERVKAMNTMKEEEEAEDSANNGLTKSILDVNMTAL